MNATVRKLLIFVLYAGLTGCLYSGPENNSEFDRVTDLRSFAGIYRNAGEPSGYLSDVIWHGMIPGRTVVNIEVRLPHEKSLSVMALDERGSVLKEQLFEEGKDFKMCQGRICLKNSTRIVGGQAQDPMLGVGNEYSELGLDQQGSGKFRSGGSAVGLVYMVIPMAVKSKEDIRFTRIGD